MSDSKPIVIDNETWNQNEFLETICSRYFIVGNQSSIGNMSWEINSHNDEDISSSLIRLNRHLKPLSLIGLLDEENPPNLTITRYPVDPVYVPFWQQILIWVTMFSFTTLAGSYWISQYEISNSVISYAILKESFIYFSLPIFSVSILAHTFRKYIASLFEVEVGNLVPVAFPLISPFWPFGIVGIFGQKRVDTITYPNRRSLGLIESSSAFVFLVSGSILSLIGISLTSDLPPEVVSDPIQLELSLIVDLLSNLFIDSDIYVRLQWAHPLVLAGSGLSIIGWILLLPIPGFPGDRILHSIIGPKNLESNENETSIFLITLGVMCIVFLATIFWPWLILASLASWRRFSGEHIPSPLVVDEALGIDKKFRNTFATVIVVALLLGFPGVHPVEQISNLDEGLNISNWSNQIDYLDEEMNTLVLYPSGIMPVSGTIQVLIDGDNERWDIDSECFEDKLICNFENISQNNHGSFNFLISDNNLADTSPVQLRLIVDTGDSTKEHVIAVKYPNVTSPDPVWQRDNLSPKERICINIEVMENQSGNLSVSSNPFWTVENSSFLPEGESELCLISEKGGWESLEIGNSGISGYRMGPIVEFKSDNGEKRIWNLPIENSYVNIFLNQTTGLQLNQVTEGILYSDTFSSPFCPSENIIPTLSPDSEDNFTLLLGSPIIIDGDYEDRSILLPESGWLVNCDINDSRAYYLKSGFDIDIDGLVMNDSKLPFSDFTINSRVDMNLTLNLDISSNLRNDSGLEISLPSSILANDSVDIGINLNEIDSEVWRVFWITQDSDSLTLNFALKCPIGGCNN